MSDVIQIDDLDKYIKKALDEYGDEISEIVQEVMKETAKEGAKVIRDNAPVDKGNYRKSITVSKSQNSYVIHSKAPHYRLTSLLEHGHVTASGTGRTQPQPHWAKGQKYIDENFEKKLKKKIEETR